MATITEDEWRVHCNRFFVLEHIWRSTKDASYRPSRRAHYNSPPDLRCFKLTKEVMQAVKARDPSKLSSIKRLDLCKSVGEYCDSLSDLLNYEELYRTIDLRQFDQFKQKLIVTYDEYGMKTYKTKVPLMGVSAPFDHVILHDIRRTWSKSFRISVADDYVTIQLPPGPVDKHLDECLNISFIWSGTPHAGYQQAIRALREKCTMQMIVWKENSDNELLEDKINMTTTDTGELKRRLEKLDSCQRQAVIGILRARCGPRAYIVIGPPGSGKSHVLVEAVVQIYKRSRMSMLVCVSSNCCADSLYKKLAENLPKSTLLRLRAGDYQRNDISCERVFICTNGKSASLKPRNIEFDYVFMDEANHSAVPESLVPLRFLKNNGCLVLFGDPMQLNPSAQWQEAGRFGLGSSLLDRLLKFNEYQVDNDNSSDYITRLVQSYRCDERILATSNELFYNQEVKCLNKTPRSILNVMRLTGAVQFVPVPRDNSQRAENLFTNEKEANCIVDLVIKLYKIGFEPEQIGVITAYKLQTSLISSKLNQAIKVYAPMLDRRNPYKPKKLKVEDICDLADLVLSVSNETPKARDWCCKIDTVAGFQGDERDIILVSTVDISNGSGKLEHPMGFNVALSRPKWLLIVVGDSNALSSGNLWPKFLDHAIKGEVEKWQMSFGEEYQSTQGASQSSRSLQGLSIADAS